MPRTVQTIRAQVIEGNDVFLMARVVTADNTILTTTDTGSADVEVRVFDKSGAGQGRTPNDAIFEKTDITDDTVIAALSTDGFWDGLDSTGYNFKYALQYDPAGTTGPYLRANHQYLVQFQVVAASGGTDFGTVHWSFVLDVLPNDPS